MGELWRVVWRCVCRENVVLPVECLGVVDEQQRVTDASCVWKRVSLALFWVLLEYSDAVDKQQRVTAEGESCVWRRVSLDIFWVLLVQWTSSGA